MIVCGIPGTGKTTVCNLAESLAKRAGIEINVLNYGTVMVGILEKLGRPVERDAMRKDDLDTQRDLQKQVAEAVSKKIAQSKGITIVDTHMSIKTSQGYLPGLPIHVLQKLKPELLVLIEARPEEISSRRMKDASRKRDDTTEDAVREELQFSRLMAGAGSVLTSAPVKIVINIEGKQEEAAKELLSTLGAASI